MFVEHPEAVETELALKWNLETLASLPVSKKLVLLQYFKDFKKMDDKRRADRNLILEEASRLGIPVVDMLDVAAYVMPPTSDLFVGPTDHWGHLSPFGSRVVCAALLAALADGAVDPPS